VNHYKEQQPALVGASRNIAPALSHKPVITVVTETPKTNQSNTSAETGYQTILPAAQEVVKESTSVDETVQKEPVEIKPSAEQQPSTTVYIVCPGDSLAEIAKKMYGPEYGNKPAAVEKIYKANKDKLTSMDEIQVGQKLIIPPLEKRTNALLKTGLFEKVSKSTPLQTSQPSKEQFRQYLVKESDSLWQIAAEQLGNGNRYEEIIELNKSVITDADTLVVGMKLKLPAR